MKASNPTTYSLKNTIFCDITPCSPLSVNRRFGGTYRLHLQGRKNKLRKLVIYFHAGFLLNLFFFTEDGGDMFLRNVVLLNGLHGVISQKTVLFTTTAVRTSNPTTYSLFYSKNFIMDNFPQIKKKQIRKILILTMAAFRSWILWSFLLEMLIVYLWVVSGDSRLITSYHFLLFQKLPFLQ
jgi:hypothetical protein